jgi:alpha-tubulin suppressor-like RCC1 family protein
MRFLKISVAVLLLVADSGCRDDATQPTGPEASPSSAVAATTAPLSFLQVSSGIDHACGVAADGKAWCWGLNGFGELGIPPGDSPFPCSSNPCALRPVAVSGGRRFLQVSAGAHFTCGLTTTGEAFCWGRNDVGQLGIGSTASFESTPTEVAGDRTYREVKAGVGPIACAISTARDAFCWGAGRLGNGTIGTHRSPVKVSGTQDWLELTVGATYACAITTANLAWCWGINNRGQFGNGTTDAATTPVRSAPGFTLAHVDAGGTTTCAVLTDARGFCWGDAVATGDGRGSGRTLNPVAVAGTRKWNNISVGALDACGVTLAGRGLCWGMGVGGELGNGAVGDHFTPVSVSGDIDFDAISAGFAFSCGVAGGGKAWCWGDNSNGQLGDGTGVQHLTPVAVAGP